MFGGDFPSNRRPYNNDRYNTNSAISSEQMDPDDPESEDSECSELSARGQSAARKRNRKKRKKRKNNNMDGDDQNINAGGRKVIVVVNQPDTHKCASFLALLLCPPIGIFAMYHSIMVTRCWDKSQSEQSQEQENSNSSNEPQRQRQEQLADGHSTRTGLYAFFGMTLGLLFWIIIYSFVAETNQYFQKNG